MQNFTEFSSDMNSEDARPSFSGMFSGAQNLAVTGQTLINTTNYYTTLATVPSDVRMVALSDIDLQHEICLDDSTGVVNRHRIQPSVPRIYFAKIGGQSTTVAVYQGRGAEEDWRQDLAKYTSIRHPNIIQIRGAASSGSICATLFYDDLIPLKHFINLYRKSHFFTVYIYAYCGAEFQEVRKYFDTNFQPEVVSPVIWMADFCIAKWLSERNGLYILDTSLDCPALRRPRQAAYRHLLR
ncbi:hypothetical protein B0H19DRAFT_708823 [Mycena capillaripes]|nr:hypothetical protein B0H19DRAFT_708823 [Mycena capillaripes]